MTTAHDRVSEARSKLILDHPWFGTLSLRLKLVETAEVPTAAVDGTHYYFNPDFIAGLNDTELVGLTAHEVLHCALRHMYRMGSRDLRRWNEACDHAINPLLVEAGFTLPKDGLNDPAFHGMAAEAIYAKLEQQAGSQAGAPGKPGGSGNSNPAQPVGGSQGAIVAPGTYGSPAQSDPAGEASDASPGPDQGMGEVDWELAVEQATAVGKRAGHTGKELARAVEHNRPSVVDWREVLRRFVQQALPLDYSWSTPSRRYLHSGTYLPGTVKESMPVLVVAIDTSASIDKVMLEQFASELNAILVDCKPEAVAVLYCDADIQAEQRFAPEDEVTIDKLTPKGGGGTRFQPVFDRVNNSDEQVAAVVYFTDLDGPVPVEPDYPTLWVTPEWCTKPAPFGEVVRFSKY